MTTTTMRGMWVEWNEAHTEIVAFGRVDMNWVGPPVLNYSYDEGWQGGSAPSVEVFPRPSNLNFQFGDGSVRFVNDVADGTSNTVFLGETSESRNFSGTVMGISDPSDNHDYYFCLDGNLPSFGQANLAGVLPFIEELTSGAQQIGAGVFGPGVPIALDGTSNTILMSENDAINGFDGTQSLQGGIGNDTMHGFDGDDVLDGGAGSDRLFGDFGSDTMTGGSGNDVLTGGIGGDVVFGGLGSDQVKGSGGADRLFGGDLLVADPTGADTLIGGGGFDSAYGGDGNDVLNGGRNDDVLVGGAGADRFVFDLHSGHDFIADLNVAAGDLLVLDKDLVGSATNGAEVIAAFGEVDGDILFLTFGTGDVLELRAVTGSLTGIENAILLV